MMIEQLSLGNKFDTFTSMRYGGKLDRLALVKTASLTLIDDASIKHAEGYPFDVPDSSYRFSDGVVCEVDSDIDGRTPVLALGSNAAPAQLARKFGAEGGSINVSRAILKDYAVVYSAHYSTYGSLPATLSASEGATTYVFVTWLDDQQLERMHESEALGVNYDFEVLQDIEVDVEGHGVLGEAAAYVSRSGPLYLRGQPIRLAEVATTNCPIPALIQPAMLRCAHKQLAPELDYSHFMGLIVENREFRKYSSELLRDVA